MTVSLRRLSPVWIGRGAFALLALTAGGLLVSYLASAHGHLDAWNHAIGRDFINAWTSGQLQREGRVLQVFDPPAFLAAERRLFDPRLPFHFWSYPPPTLLMTAPLGWLPYGPALVGWTLAGLVALAFAAQAFVGRRVEAALVLLCPAVAINAVFGQNGAFSAALLLGGLALTQRRPVLAGVLFGCLVFKPQIGLLLPVALVAERRWRTIGAAAATAGLLCLVSWLVYGVEAWRAFFAQTLPLQTAMLERGGGQFPSMMASAFMSARRLGLSGAGPWIAQLPFSALAAALVWIAWRGGADRRLKGAVLSLSTFVATPQAFHYDLIPTAAAALVMIRAEEALGAGPLAIVGLLLAVAVIVLPVVMPSLGEAGLPIAPLVLSAAAMRATMLARAPLFVERRS